MRKRENTEQINRLRKNALLLAAILVVFLFKAFVMNKVIVSGSSMQETLYSGEALWVDKLFWKSRELQRFDIVVVSTENGNIIKRIIGLPNEEIQVINGAVYIDGEQLENDYGERILDSGRANEKLLLSDDEYFVMGDNRNGSVDSRSDEVGNVGISEIVGLPFFRFYPFDKVGTVK